MERLPTKLFASPDEEIAFLRAELAARERETDPERGTEAATDTIRAYAEAEPAAVLPERRQLDDTALAGIAERVQGKETNVREVMDVVHEHGVKNALELLKRLHDPHVTDEVHRLLIEEIRGGATPSGMEEGVPPWQVLHMSLFEISLPEQREVDAKTDLATLLSAMEQFYAGMQTIGGAGKPLHYTLEIAVAEGSDEIVFYAAVPTASADLFEKQVLSLFPHAVIHLQPHDYNIFPEDGVALVSVAREKRHPIYPLRTYDEFAVDPLNVLLNAFSKIEREGGGAAVQLVVQAGGKRYHETYEQILKRVREGEKPSTAIRKSTIAGSTFETLREVVFTKKKGELPEPTHVDAAVAEQFAKKITRPIVPANLRIAVSAKDEARAAQILNEIEAGFHQFEDTNGNALTFVRKHGSAADATLRAFSFREFDKNEALPLSFAELATIMHVPASGIESSPQFKQSRAKGAAAPLDLPQEGTLLGVNSYRNVETKVYVTPEDRLRHFYIIGQTGTGKTTLMKNMIVQDIERGAGVCMIDPHGTDIADVLGAVPESRMDDVIYFDPSHLEDVIGLNMLEFDPAHPEQKTFVVNELFSIFQKLYGAVPESMGPMFEQYFRNATLLVLEDPESGSTLLDISRVLADADFRAMKLAKARNPVVVQFWREIATKAGGEAALENIVPYITSKFDVFTANDYMRPIIGQQRSAFNFRTLMDERKILLVNLAKGRLGEINANLIGMILVGKILMAALSRVDGRGGDLPPFYLHMDEFQNVTTDSIAAILSEARKYKLGLTVAHQFIAQLDENIRDAVFGNVGSIAAFRVGPDDAAALAHQFEPVFEASDLMNIENRNAYVRILANGTPTKPFHIKTMPPREPDMARAERIIRASHERYGAPRRKVEMEISSRYR